MEGAFQDFHEKRKTLFSDDEEYKDLYKKDKRTKPNKGTKKSQEKHDFWGETEKRENKEFFRKKVFDDFDEFFDFKREQREEGVTRDDTKGVDYKTKVMIDFD